MKKLLFVLIVLLTSALKISAQELIPYLQSTTQSSIIISWETENDEESIVRYGLKGAPLSLQASGSYEKLINDRHWHFVKINGLDAATVYNYQIKTSNNESKIFHFKTFPAKGMKDGKIRIVWRSDNQSHHDVATNIVDAMVDNVTQNFGSDLAESVDLIFTSGDIVGTGWDINQYQKEYFGPLQPLTPYIPSMVTIGNHEAESDYYYQYMKYEDFAGPQGEGYYTYKLGPILIIALNSNSAYRVPQQLDWLDARLKEAEEDEDIMWVFATTHHPGVSSLWSPGNTSYVQNDIIPILQKYTKPEFLIYGHSHNYERGAELEGFLRLMCCGGSGGGLDRWGDNNWADYAQIHRAFDHYHYVIFEFDIKNKSYVCQVYSQGNPDRPLYNVTIDSFGSSIVDRDPPAAPITQAFADSIDLPHTLKAGKYSSPTHSPLMSSHFQVTDKKGSYAFPVVDEIRHFENWFLDSGAPDYIPIDQNEGIDLSSYEIAKEKIAFPGTYYWRARYRSQNLAWSKWSDEQEIKIRETGYEPVKNSNKALNFDGSKSYVALATDLNESTLPKREMTVETWVYLRSHYTWGGYIGAFEDNGDYEKGWVLGNQGDAFSFALASSGKDDGDGYMTYLKAAQKLELNRWYHVAGVFDGTSMKIYVNGTLSSETTAQHGDILYDANSYFDIGAYHDDNEFFVHNGQLDEVRLWKRALSEQEIRNGMYQTVDSTHVHFKDLVSYWDLNDLKSNTIKDKQKRNTGTWKEAHVTYIRPSGAPIGSYGTFWKKNLFKSAGPTGQKITGVLAANHNQSSHLGLAYSRDNNSGSITWENLPDGLKYRSAVYWMAHEVGSVRADIELDYSAIEHIAEPDSLFLLYKPTMDAPWQNISAEAIHSGKKIILKNQESYGYYALGWKSMITGLTLEQTQIAQETELLPGYPNPFNGSTKIRYHLKEKSKVRLEIFNANGQKVRLISDTQQNAGSYAFTFDASGFASGVYFYRLLFQEENRTRALTRKMVLLK